MQAVCIGAGTGKHGRHQDSLAGGGTRVHACMYAGTHVILLMVGALVNAVQPHADGLAVVYRV